MRPEVEILINQLKREVEILIDSPLIITHPYLKNLYLRGVDIEGHPIWAEKGPLHEGDGK